MFVIATRRTPYKKEIENVLSLDVTVEAFDYFLSIS